MRKMRVPLPVSNSEEWLTLAKKIQAKHIADGAGSLLNHLDWTSINATIEKVDAMHAAAEALRVQSAQRMIDRDAFMEELRTSVRSMRDSLTSVYIRNMKTLGDWGFNVVEAPAPRRRTVAASETPVAKQETTV